MKIKQLILEEFTAFAKTDVHFSPGLNVFIGANSTGKSHLMKLLYSTLKTCESSRKDGITDEKLIVGMLKEKLARVFQPDDLQVGRLVRRAVGQKSATARTLTEAGEFSFTLTTRGNVRIDANTLSQTKPCIFIPSREALAMYHGFIHAYKERELSFDETYYDLCVALSGRPLRGPRLKDAAKLVGPFEQLLGGKVVLDGDRFHVHSKDGILEAHLLAEGFRKIGGLVHLINNGSLMENGVLFWDEPEANLNPKLVTQVAGVLRFLASRGVQVFIASHDYLLTYELSLAAEYDTEPAAHAKFFCLARQGVGPVVVTSGPTLAHLDDNPILDEFAAHYDRERELFSERAKAAGKGEG